jgi:hypothetical protein
MAGKMQGAYLLPVACLVRHLVPDFHLGQVDGTQQLGALQLHDRQLHSHIDTRSTRQ